MTMRFSSRREKVYLIIKYKHPDVPLPSFPEFVNLIKRSRKFELIDTGETTFYDLPESIEKTPYGS
jgi:hypothetical protein